ncbi:MAG: hypothetical protein COW01_04650 [Bdellovibrionales bacterium CG12_big_fil_rev_8_21_14_0_65_38_15]|nr:MAG: hypothetical protein COW79_11970 [Bdellovibrionales bacterium CG22_combo_CG10-13_8_21_14_all_38_13]PIQ56347.1 MAG: hypothetical protein COW01_04650 [Bdellovibrionales bacterium CG12_big_fil_rev_8_21_14_0_65_38_15]PIR29378.1 MAG: hypothetical protein COV38_11585 [Bdellovibrionales bacterium CG11_big_fil_rev_8_21_14_0_20_38_13]
MKKLITLFICYSLSISAVFAQGLDKCAFMKSKQTKIIEMKEALAAMKDLQAERSKAREIRDLLVDTADSREIALLAEALDDEARSLEADGRFNRNVVIGTSLGSIILASLMIKKMKSTLQGTTVLSRLVTAIKSANKTAVGKILTGTFVVSIAASFWFSKRMNEIDDKREFLISLVVKLDALKDLADQIITLEEEVEQEEISFGIRIEQLRSEGVLDYNGAELKCL